MVIYDVAFTYRKNTKAVDRPSIKQEDYDTCLETLRKFGEVVTYVYETSDKGVLHIHGICSIPHDVKYTHMKIKGYSSKMERIYNRKGWEQYLKKDQKYAEKLSHELSYIVMQHDYETKTQPEGVNPPREEDEPLTPVEHRINPPKQRLF